MQWYFPRVFCAIWEKSKPQSKPFYYGIWFKKLFERLRGKISYYKIMTTLLLLYTAKAAAFEIAGYNDFYTKYPTYILLFWCISSRKKEEKRFVVCYVKYNSEYRHRQLRCIIDHSPLIGKDGICSHRLHDGGLPAIKKINCQTS